jgi:hypothetical protein
MRQEPLMPFILATMTGLAIGAVIVGAMFSRFR